jgi:hypothetical protein
MKQSERAVLRRWTRQEYERLIDHGFLAISGKVKPYFSANFLFSAGVSKDTPMITAPLRS